MARTCTICSHEKRMEIDSAFVAGASYRSIAKQFGCSEAAMYRHTSEHIAREVKQLQSAQKELRGLDVVKQLKTINGITLTILKEARNTKDNDTALKAVDRVTKQLELQAKLLGDIDRPAAVYLSPEWLDIRKALVQALLPFPDARMSVASVLAQMEDARVRLN